VVTEEVVHRVEEDSAEETEAAGHKVVVDTVAVEVEVVEETEDHREVEVMTSVVVSAIEGAMVATADNEIIKLLQVKKIKKG
jgi:hypothetical protein